MNHSDFRTVLAYYVDHCGSEWVLKIKGFIWQKDWKRMKFLHRRMSKMLILVKFRWNIFDLYEFKAFRIHIQYFLSQFWSYFWSHNFEIFMRVINFQQVVRYMEGICSYKLSEVHLSTNFMSSNWCIVFSILVHSV